MMSKIMKIINSRGTPQLTVLYLFFYYHTSTTNFFISFVSFSIIILL